MKEATVFKVARLSRRAGIPRLARLVRHSDLRIALSHYVDDVHMDGYRRVVEMLLEERTPRTPQEILAAYDGSGRALPRGRHVGFSFDDGLLSSYHAAQRVLNPLGLKAMFFIPTQILSLGTPEEMRAFFMERVYRRPSSAMPESHYVTMTADHMRELHAQGHLVLPHTHSHIALAEIVTGEDVRAELAEPRERLEDLLQSPARGFAFPFGTERVVSRTAYDGVRRHYDVTLTGLVGANTARTPPYALFRDCLHPHQPMPYLRDVVAGALDPVYLAKMLKLRRVAAI